MSRNASSSSSSTGAAAAATGLSLLLETPGLWGVASDILRMLDLKTFVAMERVCKAAERYRIIKQEKFLDFERWEFLLAIHPVFSSLVQKKYSPAWEVYFGRCMAGSGAWRRRLLQVERSRRDPGVTRMLESK